MIPDPACQLRIRLEAGEFPKNFRCPPQSGNELVAADTTRPRSAGQVDRPTTRGGNRAQGRWRPLNSRPIRGRFSQRSQEN
jgi:hypothetical protein